MSQYSDSIKILVVEDNQENQSLLSAALSLFGYQAIVANTGREALQQIIQNSYQLVLMDCKMPDLDGLSATRYIRQLQAPKNEVPVIGVTACAMVGDREKCLEAGMNEYISKPINLRQLQQLIETCLYSG